MPAGAVLAVATSLPVAAAGSLSAMSSILQTRRSTVVYGALILALIGVVLLTVFWKARHSRDLRSRADTQITAIRERILGATEFSINLYGQSGGVVPAEILRPVFDGVLCSSRWHKPAVKGVCVGAVTAHAAESDIRISVFSEPRWILCDGQYFELTESELGVFMHLNAKVTGVP